jgi:ribosomal protein L16 Arg81 hydroxylase
VSVNVSPDFSAIGSLARLFAGSPETFAGEVWSTRPWLSRAGELPGSVEEIFSAQAVDELLSRRGLRTPFIRLAKNGRVLASSRFTGSGGAGASIADQVVDDSVLRLFADGTTVVLQAVHRTWPEVGELAAGLAEDLGHPVQVNAYITPPQSTGFAPHYDTHDVFVLQIAGHKKWQVHDPVFHAPLPENPWETVSEQVGARAEQTPVIDAVLEPGDCLYLPRGFIHSAQALGGTSVHLTFGIHPVVERDIVETLLKSVQQDGWREALPAGWDPMSADGTSQVKSILAKTQEALAALDVNEVAATLYDQRAALQRPAPLPPIAQADAAANLSPDTILVRRKHLGLRLDDDSTIVLPGGRRVPIPEPQRDALDMALAGEPFRVDGLPLEVEHGLELSRRLLVAGVVMKA